MQELGRCWCSVPFVFSENIISQIIGDELLEQLQPHRRVKRREKVLPGQFDESPITWASSSAEGQQWQSANRERQGPTVFFTMFFFFRFWEIRFLVHENFPNFAKTSSAGLCADSPDGGATAFAKGLKHWKYITNRLYVLRLCFHQSVGPIELKCWKALS